MLEIKAERLKLVALDARLAGLQSRAPEAFFEALGVQSEASWPPELMDKSAMDWCEEQLSAQPDAEGWYFWAFIWPGFMSGMDRLVGGGGFKGPPDQNGAVEIGYSMLVSFREQGLATEAVNALVEWAFSSGQVREVVAETLPHLIASQRVLEKTGFVETGSREEDGMKILRFALQREKAAA
ncbi:GNAT family N-acetyltransferase [Hyphobacterium sp. HN65]|uniref:GNAT family N-acetyltransferase n=1 Tax=Hyphobacterium lacteum TaxID=3116575 RepID=A0ABU7LSL2_9PROT|nr:GNAT family N-acetyltransferase [Hyphobacterium sp. HN65]MEE2526907.1 GNAT family N-acetyltransferase [Hyphobacterium sp. HN65]